MSLLRAGYFTLVAVIACGCSSIEKGTRNMKDATANVKEGAASLSEGLKKVDLLGLKKLLEENADLRGQLGLIQARLSSLPTGEGRVVLAGRRVLVRVVPLDGDAFVRGWVGMETNEFVSRRLTPTRKDLPLTYDVAQTALREVLKESGSEPGGVGPALGAARAYKRAEPIDREYKRRVEAAFDAFRRNAKAFHFGHVEVDIHPKLAGQTGLRLVEVEVTPHDPKAKVRIECVSRPAAKDGVEELIYHADLEPKGKTVRKSILLDVRVAE